MNNLVNSFLREDLIYYISKEYHDEKSMMRILTDHPEIKFVSLVCVDLGGNDTDERIPIEALRDNFNNFIKDGVQTDGSSVVLPGIATLNNGKVDLFPDTSVNWFVDYNCEFLDLNSKKPVGTIKIPCFLSHCGENIDSRSLLKKVSLEIEKYLLSTFDKNPNISSILGFSKDEIEKITLTAATELEFWVRTPENINFKVSELSASENMQEQYWKRTKGSVRTSMEQSLLSLKLYGMEPEMGHKEVGGVKAKLTSDGATTDILEQLEIDWKYSDAIQAADNEMFARILIKEIFFHNGLDVSFKAKPIRGVSGSGEHTHFSISATLKNGKNINLFTPKNPLEDYLSIPGWGALLGFLKNYEAINPFVSNSNDSLERLQPGFEAPVCVVASIGNDLREPSRNRTVLIGLIRDLENPFATRFELRSPNPHSNTYLVIATSFLAILDGIKYAFTSGKSTKELESEFKKSYGEDCDYLLKNRIYQSEKDVFTEYSDEERIKFFGNPPKTVWDCMEHLVENPIHISFLTNSGIFSDQIIASYRQGALSRWLIEITAKFIPKNAKRLSQMINLHEDRESVNDLDIENWNRIKNLKLKLLKDDLNTKSIFTSLRSAIEAEDYPEISRLLSESKMMILELIDLYIKYKRNVLSV